MELAEVLQHHSGDRVSVANGVGYLIGVDIYPNRSDKKTDLVIWTEPLVIVQFSRSDFTTEVWTTQFSLDHRPEYDRVRPFKGGACVTKAIPISEVLDIVSERRYEEQHPEKVVAKLDTRPVVVGQIWKSKRGKGDRFKVIELDRYNVTILDLDDPGGYTRQTSIDSLPRFYEYLETA